MPLPRSIPIVCTLILICGCFSPSYPENLACDVDGWCPPGQTCNAQDICVSGDDGGSAADAGPVADASDVTDAEIFDANDLGALLSISIGDDVTLAVEETHQFEVTATYELGTLTVTDWAIWRSSNTAIAWVDFTGLVTAAAVGQVTITATYEGRVDDAVVTVE